LDASGIFFGVTSGLLLSYHSGLLLRYAPRAKEEDAPKKEKIA
jgi:hypothetical protein